MDNGEVIGALNDDWTFGGANLMEWMSGFVMFLLASELVDKVSRTMPLLMIIWIGTTFLLAAGRRSFPDEEVGLRNFLSVSLGFVPIGLPAPAKLQPIWSGFPMKEISNDAQYSILKLDEIINNKELDQEVGERLGYVPQPVIQGS